MPLTSAELIADPIGRYPHATVACFDPTRGDLPRCSNAWRSWEWKGY